MRAARLAAIDVISLFYAMLRCLILFITMMPVTLIRLFSFTHAFSPALRAFYAAMLRLRFDAAAIAMLRRFVATLIISASSFADIHTVVVEQHIFACFRLLFFFRCLFFYSYFAS